MDCRLLLRKFNSIVQNTPWLEVYFQCSRVGPCHEYIHCHRPYSASTGQVATVLQVTAGRWNISAWKVNIHSYSWHDIRTEPKTRHLSERSIPLFNVSSVHPMPDFEMVLMEIMYTQWAEWLTHELRCKVQNETYLIWKFLWVASENSLWVYCMC